MPLRESEAIVLRSFPLGEGDKLVSFLTRSFGRLRGVARGARRTKNRFGASLEPLSHIRVWFFERETRELVRVQQCELMESFLDAHKNLAASGPLALLTEITEATLPEREPSDAAFRLLLICAKGMRDADRIALSLSYFALWSLRIGGWLPELDRCSKCNRALENEAAFTSFHRPGLFCSKCRVPGMTAIGAGALAFARRMLKEKLNHLEGRGFSADGIRDLTSSCLNLIEHHVERKLQARKTLESMA